MSYEPCGRFNPDMLKFFSRAQSGYTPYQGSLLRYEYGIQNPDLMRNYISDEIDEVTDKLETGINPGFDIPRATVAGTGNGDSTVGDPSGPFDPVLEFDSLTEAERE
jgi:hypothetical protein